MLPATYDRVMRNTASSVNRHIADRMAKRLHRYASNPTEIDYRLAELDREWDVDRMLAAHSGAAMLGGLALALLVDRRYLMLSALSAVSLMQHSLKGWCLPLPMLRRIGVRTAAEIDQERYALKALRGDFQDIPQAGARQSGLQQPGEVEPGEGGPGTPTAVARLDRVAATIEAVRR